MNTSVEIQHYIGRLSKEKPFLSSMLLKYGSRAAIDKTLSRLAKNGEIVRITRGVYARPGHNPYVGEVLPGPFEIAKTIAAKTNSLVQVHGIEAARQFGFTTQVPAHPTFYTTGPSREFMLGNLEIHLKHISPRKLVLTESKAGLAILALWYLGKKQVTAQSIEVIKEKLNEKEFEKFTSSVEYMPHWMIEAISAHQKREFNV